MKKIVKVFKHIFIPHEHNNYKPHFFREISVISILIIVVVLLSTSLGSQLYIKKTNMMSAVLPAVLVDLVNKDRTTNGEPALTKNSLLESAAKQKAEDMASNQYFAHTSPQGITPWYWFNKVGYYFTYAGENLAIDFNESQDVETAWLNSPKHRENIMSNNFTEIGIATAEGYYNGSPTTYVVQMFGTPAFISKANAETTPIAPVVTSKTETKKVQTTNNETKPSTTPATPEVAVAPVVKGESVAEGDSKPVVTEDKVKVIKETNNYIFVENTDKNNDQVALQTPTNVTPSPKYSTWKERLMFMLPSYADKMYKIFVWIVIIALLLMVGIEVRRQHPKNIAYGALLLVIIFCFIYINHSMFINSIFAFN